MREKRIWLLLIFLLFGLITGCWNLNKPKGNDNQKNNPIPQNQLNSTTTPPLTNTAIETNNSSLQLPGTILISSNNPGVVYLYSKGSLDQIKISSEDIHQPSPVLSPDGTKIVFRDLDGNLNVYDLSTREFKKYSDIFTNGNGPMGWSPSGDQIAFGCSTIPANVCVLSIKTEQIENFTANLPNNDSGSYAGYNFAGWEKKENKMALLFYSESPSSGGQTFFIGTLEMLDIQTKAITKVITESDFTGTERIRDAMLSPEGTTIIFSAKSGEYYAIYQINTDGTRLNRVTPETYTFDIVHPIWNSDGKYFVASAPKIENESNNAIILPTIFDPSGNLVGQINITGGGEAVSWNN
ncbi:MAG: hypothetical protein NTZ74_06835 [Chloroflexi bacterium]|nr:hypothetical protein [Chloroflexota bacterium]